MVPVAGQHGYAGGQRLHHARPRVPPPAQGAIRTPLAAQPSSTKACTAPLQANAPSQTRQCAQPDTLVGHLRGDSPLVAVVRLVGHAAVAVVLICSQAAGSDKQSALDAAQPCQGFTASAGHGLQCAAVHAAPGPLSHTA